MLDLLSDSRDEIVPARKRTARVAGTFSATGNHFETRAVSELVLGFDGIAGDYHSGRTRRAGGREPWYPRGTEILNTSAFARGGGRDGRNCRAYEHRRAAAGMDWRQPGHRGPCQPVHAAGRNAAVFQGRRDPEGGRPEPSMPPRWQFSGPACRDGRPASRCACLRAGGQAPSRTGGLGGEAGYSSAGGGHFRPHSGAMDIPRLTLAQASSSSGSSSRVERQAVSTALIWSMTKKRAASRS
jgi:hypothetical protein